MFVMQFLLDLRIKVLRFHILRSFHTLEKFLLPEDLGFLYLLHLQLAFYLCYLLAKLLHLFQLNHHYLILALFLREFFGATSGKVKLGTGGGGTNPTSTTLDVPLPASTDSSTTSSSSDDKVVEFRGTFTGTELQGYTIREMGIFGNLPTDAEMALIDTSGYDYSPTENVMLARVNFEGVGNFSTSDTIEIIYTMEVE